MLLKTSPSRILQVSYILASTELASGLPFHIRSLIASKRLFATMSNRNTILSRVTPENIALEIKDPVDPTALEQVKAIMAEIRLPSGKIDAEKLIEVGIRLGDLTEGPFVVSPDDCRAAFEGLTDIERNALVNIHSRVKTFAEAQRKAVVDMEIDIPGGKAGHNVSPCKAAGCYAPGGRYPLPSSVIMTAVTARAAGCETVILASPRPALITLAAAHIAGVTTMICLGGAQAIAAMAYGVEGAIPSCDVIVGPGNKWVTAAKSIVSGHCGIDMLAGPSEVLVICDDTADAEIVAADLIAQAEHDVVARAILVSTSESMIDAIDAQVSTQLACLPEPNQSTAREAMKLSFAVLCDSIEQCIAISDDIAPEHLEIQTVDSWKVAQACGNYGGLFVGKDAAEVLGDYGAGPNHTLPTGGTGRYTGGLSVFNFLRIRTWMRIDDTNASQPMVDDSIVMARLEGLEGHARAAEARSTSRTPAYKSS